MTADRMLYANLGYLIAGEDQTNNLQASAKKLLSVNTYAADQDVSSAAEASSITKAAPGNIYGGLFSNANALARFWQFYNSTTLPADGVVPLFTIACPATSTISVSFPDGLYCSVGSVWATSSTQNTKTIGAADAIALVLYK